MSKVLNARLLAFLFVLLFFIPGVSAQKRKNPANDIGRGNNVLWERVDIGKRDLFYGPGGEAMQPDLSQVKFVKQETGGHNKKYRIVDGSGRTWVAKLGTEARPETAAVRLLHGIGYKTEINYLVPTITIPGKGTFRNVRLEARPDNIERLGQWKWKQNPFVGTHQLQGLKMMMVFMTNYDVLDLQNKVLQVGNERHYIVSDLGATFGKLGNNNLPIIFRLGRSTGKPNDYIRTQFIRRVKKGRIELSYKGKSRSVFKDITVADGRWLYSQLRQLEDRQIEDAFRAAAYSPSEVEIYRRAVRNKINELKNVVGEDNLAVNDK
jgi:hypothetical protein